MIKIKKSLASRLNFIDFDCEEPMVRGEKKENIRRKINQSVDQIFTS